jgi:hypothetical protein
MTLAALFLLLIENARGLTVLLGAALLYHGIAGFSLPAANVTAGLLLMAVGAFPYLRRTKGKA